MFVQRPMLPGYGKLRRNRVHEKRGPHFGSLALSLSVTVRAKLPSRGKVTKLVKSASQGHGHGHRVTVPRKVTDCQCHCTHRAG
eukprot:3053887-Rhodomonas_salina.1